MYIIDDTYFQYPKRDIPNVDEADSKSFVELEMLIDEKCRLFMRYFLTEAEVTDFESYLVNGMFPTITTGIPQKWIDLVNGKDDWKGLIYSLGTSKNSLLADFVYYHYLVNQVSYMTGVGDAKANPKGASLVNPTQRIVTIWNDFLLQYQGSLELSARMRWEDFYANDSLFNFLNSNFVDFPYRNVFAFEVKNQLGL